MGCAGGGLDLGRPVGEDTQRAASQGSSGVAARKVKVEALTKEGSVEMRGDELRTEDAGDRVVMEGNAGVKIGRPADLEEDPAPHQSLPGPSREAEVTSRRLEVDNKARIARFIGDVRASYTGLEISCQEMTVAYESEGEISSLKATGGVLVERGDVLARADFATLDAKRGVLVLEGRPSLKKGGSTLQGSRIEMGLSDGRLQVVDARGTFKLGERGK